MTHSWWRKAFKLPPRSFPRARRRQRRGVILLVEPFEERLAPSANTYQWTGASSLFWNNASNWVRVSGSSGSYPGDGSDGNADIAQFVDPALKPGVYPTVNGAFSIGEIDFGSASNVTINSDGVSGHGLTLSGTAQIVAANSFGKPNTGNDVVAVPLTIASTLSVSDTAGTLTVSGNISGSGSLTVSGSGLTLSGTNTYTGSTTLTSSTTVLQLGTPTQPISSLPGGPMNDNGTLVVYLPTASLVTYGGVISGTGGLTLASTGGTLILGAANTYTGATAVGANTLKQGVANALPPFSACTVGSGSNSGLVDLNGFNAGIGSISALGTGTSNALTNSGSTLVTLTLNCIGFATNINAALTGNLSLLISGSGTETLSGVNTYSGGTIITGTTVILGNSAALPTGTALVVGGSGTLNLDGNSVSVASLTGIGNGNKITTPTSATANLKITGSAAAVYTGAITGPVSLTNASPAGTTILGDGPLNTFSGGVTATSGTLEGVPGSFGTGPLTLNGGTMDWTPSGAVVNFGGNGTGWTLNNVGGGALFQAADTLQLTSAAGPEATSFFYATPVQPNAGFTASFVYQDQSPGSSNPGNGITFTIQADPQGPFILGGSGTSLGYGPGGDGSNPDGSIQNSLAVALNLASNAAGGLGTQLFTDGVVAAYVNPGGSFSFLSSGDPIQVVLTYNSAAQTLTETATDMATSASAFVEYYDVNLASILGMANAFIGFTASTGTASAQQRINGFSYASAPGIGTSYGNTLQATAGTTSNLLVQVNSLAHSYTDNGSLTVPGSSTLNIAPDASSTTNASYSVMITGNCTLGGALKLPANGTQVGNLTIDGALSGVGTSIGSLAGFLTLPPGSSYNVVLGGTSAGLFSHLTVSQGSATLGGNLSISYANGFAPHLGEGFNILTCVGITTEFAQGTSITSGNVTFSIAYSSSGITLFVSSVQAATKLVVNAPATATAGSPFSITVAAEDSSGYTAGGYNGTVTLSSSAGADLMPTSVAVANGMATVPVTLTATGNQTLTASATGLAGGISGTIAVATGPLGEFIVSVIGNTTIPAGTGFLVSIQAADASGNPITNYSGPAAVTVSTTPASSASNFPTSIMMGSNGLGLFLGTLQQVGSYTITASSGTLSGTTSSPLAITAGNAVKLGFASQPVNSSTGTALPAVTVQVQDAYGNVVPGDNSDMVTVAVASGPGAFAPGSTITVPVANGVATFTNLVLGKLGTYQFSALVPGKYIGPNSHTFTVEPLQVVPGSFAAFPAGFSLSFTGPFLVNSVTPALYGIGLGPTATVNPTVTLTGPSGPVAGSVVINSTANGLTFVETTTASVVNNNGVPILPDGTYIARIVASGVNGLQAFYSGGGYLDGTNSGAPGHDFTASFTIGAGAAKDDVLWIPPTADGPGQPLNAPGNNQVGGGFPIYLNDTSGQVSNVQVTLNYNPALLTVTGTTGKGFSLLNTSTPGRAVLQYSGPALPGGNQVTIGFVTATVPSGTTTNPVPYKAKDLLHLSAISLNGGTISVVAGDALHLVAYVGDADGNGSYDVTDAEFVRRVTIATDTGFTAHPLVDPTIVADTDGFGFIPSDAALQVTEASVGFTTANLPNPPVPSGVQFSPIPNNVDPAVSLPSRLQVGAGGIVTVPVNIDDTDPAGSLGLSEAHLALVYDPAVFTVSAADVHLGSLLAATPGWSLATSINQVTGQIAIALSSNTPIRNSLGGSLVAIDFHQNGEPGPGTTAIALVASVNPTGKAWVTTELEDPVGSFLLTPAPSNGFDPRIDSIVTLLGPPLTATRLPSMLTGPIQGLVPGDSVFQIANSPLFTAPWSAVALAEQVTDLIFQALAQGSDDELPYSLSRKVEARMANERLPHGPLPVGQKA